MNKLALQARWTTCARYLFAISSAATQARTEYDSRPRYSLAKMKSDKLILQTQAGRQTRTDRRTQTDTQTQT